MYVCIYTYTHTNTHTHTHTHTHISHDSPLPDHHHSLRPPPSHSHSIHPPQPSAASSAQGPLLGLLKQAPLTKRNGQLSRGIVLRPRAKQPLSVCIRVYLYHVCTHVYVYVYACLCVCVCVCVCVYIYIYIYNIHLTYTCCFGAPRAPARSSCGAGGSNSLSSTPCVCERAQYVCVYVSVSV